MCPQVWNLVGSGSILAENTVIVKAVMGLSKFDIETQNIKMIKI